MSLGLWLAGREVFTEAGLALVRVLACGRPVRPDCEAPERKLSI